MTAVSILMFTAGATALRTVHTAICKITVRSLKPDTAISSKQPFKKTLSDSCLTHGLAPGPD